MQHIIQSLKEANRQDLIPHLNKIAGNEFTYMMLGRLQSDCNHFLGAGRGNEKNLHQGNVEDQIKEMKKLWNKLPKNEKPEWLSMKDINNYEKKMKRAKK